MEISTKILEKTRKLNFLTPNSQSVTLENQPTSQTVAGVELSKGIISVPHKQPKKNKTMNFRTKKDQADFAVMIAEAVAKGVTEKFLEIIEKRLK